MDSQFKRNFAISVLLHGLVFAGFFLAMAFAPTPRLDVPTIIEIVGGGGGGPELERPPSRPAPPEPAEPPHPQPKQEETPQKTEPIQQLKPKEDDVVIPKETIKTPTPETGEEKPKVEKKEVPKKTETPKQEAKKETKPNTEQKPKSDTKPMTRAQFDKKNNQSKTPAKPDSRYTANSVRSRFASNLMKVESYGSGPGPANGLSGKAGSDLEAYCSMLSSRLYRIWDIPGQATTSMSSVVVVRVTSDGTLTFVKILKPSGSLVMDETAIAAVNKLRQADPLPPSLGSVRELTVTFQPLGA